MTPSQKSLIVTAIACVLLYSHNAKAFSFTDNDLSVDFHGKFKVETFFSHNNKLLNDENDMDKVWYAQHALDLNLHTLYGKEKYGHEAIEFYFNIRNKAHWGNPTSIASTTTTSTKISDFVTKGHKHSIGKHVFWIRELWLKCSLGALLGVDSDVKHFFTVGSFPFQLGRGIALGNAFSVNPGLLGFYSDDAVDQYAFAGRLSGDIVDDKLMYDFYAAVVENKSDSFKRTAEKIRSQYIGDCNFLPGRVSPFRGYGKINYVLAGRLNWRVIDSESLGRVMIEPYIMYNRAPEQKVEFDADSNSKLGTWGIAAEWEGSRFEGGFDTALNFGRQQVVSLDRNHIDLKKDSTTGNLQLRYTHVLDADPTDTSASPNKVAATSANATIVDNGRQNITDNSQQIGTSGLYNATDRFRKGYENKYRGWMFVADAAYWFKPKVFKGAVSLGFATGDESPNRNLDDPKDAEKDAEYKGFLGLQEVYAGKRVVSAFVLGARRLPRPLSVPAVGNQFASTISEFTNLVFGGAGCHWTPKDSKHKIHVNPNVLSFWQEYRTKKFDRTTNLTTDCLASRYLGTEINIFADMLLIKNLKAFVVLSGFISGSHYDDIQGKPINRGQRTFLDNLDRTGYTQEPEPLLGNDNAFMLNLGIEYKF